MLLATLLAIASASAPASCTLNRAVPASVREVARDPERWLDRCIRLEGYVRWNRYYADVAGAYSAHATDAADRMNDGWLGLYLPGQLTADLRRGTVWGVLQDCHRNYERAAAEAGPNTLVMMLGYCHYTSGLNLQRGGFRPSGAAAFERQTGAVARALFGDLIEATAEHGPPPEMVELADRFLDALRRGEEAALAELVGPWSEVLEDEASEDAFNAFIRGEGPSPIADLRGTQQPQRRYFREKTPSSDAEFGYAERWHVCFCRLGDCTGRWPISAWDSATLAHRPYVCLRGINEQSLEQAPNRLALDRADNGLLEPHR